MQPTLLKGRIAAYFALINTHPHEDQRSGPMKNNIRSNFDMLRAYEAQLWRLGALAERYFAEDPNTSLLKLRQLSELLAQSLAARTGLYTSPEETQYELIRRLQGEGVLPKEVKQVFDQIRVTGNAANHALQGDHAAALSTLKLCWQLCLWFHRTFKDPAYRSGPFVPPQPPADESAELRAELAQLRQAVAVFQSQQEQVSNELQSTKTQLSSISEERGIWEQLATESDRDKARLAEQLAALQAVAAAAPAVQLQRFLLSAATAATQVQLDETETRRIIDEQLRQAGWEADTQTLRYSKGTFMESPRQKVASLIRQLSGFQIVATPSRQFSVNRFDNERVVAQRCTQALP